MKSKRAILWLLASFGAVGAAVLAQVFLFEAPPSDNFPLELRCVDSSPLPGGFSRCSNGLVHRPSVEECPSDLPRRERSAGEPGSCEYDTDCREFPHGHCDLTLPLNTRRCQYGCVKDSECEPDQICLCDTPVGHCVDADCRADHECSGGAVCGKYFPLPGCVHEAFTCQSRQDECAGGCSEGRWCTADDGIRYCSSPNCIH